MSQLKMSHEIFASEEFTDEKIFEQLRSLDHQLLLKDHGPWLLSLGPCVVTLASAMSKTKTKGEALECMKKCLNEQQKELDHAIVDVLCKNGDAVLEGMKLVAESYLARSGRALPSWGEGSEGSTVPDVALKGETGVYRPKKFLARGSAGLIYLAEKEGKEDYVLKRVYPTQYDSAINEFKIATRLRGCSGCLSYLDCIETGEKEIWLVLPLVARSERYGVDLREYITNGFFQVSENQLHARALVLQLLEGLEQVSSRGIIMRDVKPDNCLVRLTKDGRYEAFWTDFGLAVDVGPNLDGAGLRRVLPGSEAAKTRDDFVCWWYDTCKLVPRPKWQARRPPERGFQDPKACGNSAHSFDSYMTGIIFTCMAIGVDLPHIDQADCKAAFEKVLGKSLEKTYLQSLELGQSMTMDPVPYSKAFEQTFGTKFGSALFKMTKEILSLDPVSRPKPGECLNELRKAI